MKTKKGLHTLFAISLILRSGLVFGQSGAKEISRQQLIWLGYFNTIEFSDKLFLTTEIQERRFFNPDRQHQFVTRTHLHYKLGHGWDLAAGFTYFLQSPQDPYSSDRLTIPELRPHAEFNYKQNAGKITLSHRYKVEWRFIQNTRNYFRFRYRFGIDFPLIKKGKDEPLLKAKVSDEIHINVGKKINRNVFDQNRIYIALNYQINPNYSLEMGYLNWFQQRTTGEQFYNRNIIRLTLFHKISLNKRI